MDLGYWISYPGSRIPDLKFQISDPGSNSNTKDDIYTQVAAHKSEQLDQEDPVEIDTDLYPAPMWKWIRTCSEVGSAAIFSRLELKRDLSLQHSTQVNVAKYSPSRFYIASADKSGEIIFSCDFSP
jgi:hypothetical protein